MFNEIKKKFFSFSHLVYKIAHFDETIYKIKQINSRFALYIDPDNPRNERVNLRTVFLINRKRPPNLFLQI
jgi:hypothetical protein